MWVVIGGRLHREIKDAIQEYLDIQIRSYEMVDDYKHNGGEVRGVLLMDAGMYSIKEWGTVVQLINKLEGVPTILYLRNKELGPDTGIIGDKVRVEYVEGAIYINNVVRDIRELQGVGTDG